MDEQPAVRPDDAVIRGASETSRGPWTGAAGTWVHGTQRQASVRDGRAPGASSSATPRKGQNREAAKGRRAAAGFEGRRADWETPGPGSAVWPQPGFGRAARGSAGDAGPLGLRQARARQRSRKFWACFLSSVYCFLDLELERRRPRDYKPSPRVCAEEPRGLRGWLRGSRAPRSPRLLWTATPAEPLFLKLGRFADLSRKFFLVPGTLARLLSSAECVSATLLSQKKRVKVQLVEISPFSSWKRV